MSKKIFCIPLFLIIFLLMCPIPQTHIAYAEEETEESLEENVNDILNELDLTGYDKFISYLKDKEGGYFSKSIRDIINEVLNGDIEYDFTFFLNFIWNLLIGEIGDIIPKMILIIIIAYFCGIMHNISSGFAKKDVQRIVYLACFGLIITIIVYVVAQSITRAISTFELLEKFCDGCFPVLLSLLSALGGSASAGIYQPFVLIFGTVLIKMINIIIMPLFYTTFVFGIVGNLSDNLKLEKITKGVKSVAQWILGITFSLFITLLTAQGITGASFDGLASRGAKYALSGYVPIIGNYLKEGFDIVVASCIVVKNSLGLCSVLIILIAILAPIIRVIVIILSLKITAGIIEPISDVKFADVVSSAAESMKILIVALLCASFSMLILLMMIIFTCNFGII